MEEGGGELQRSNRSRDIERNSMELQVGRLNLLKGKESFKAEVEWMICQKMERGSKAASHVTRQEKHASEAGKGRARQDKAQQVASSPLYVDE